MSLNLDALITEYLEHCEIQKNLSQNTIKMYHFYLADFSEWVKDFLKKHNDFAFVSEKLVLPSAEQFDHDGGYAAILSKNA